MSKRIGKCKLTQTTNRMEVKMSPRKMTSVILMAILFLACVIVPFRLWENNDANEILVVQTPVSGELTFYADAGIKWQGMGKVTKYRKLADQEFSSPVMFNDNGTGTLHGRYQVEMPLDTEHLTSLHTTYGSQEAIEHSLVKATVDKVIYMTGPLMSSKESSAERKTDLIRFIADQLDHGVYRTTQRTATVEDVMSKEKRTVTVAEIVIKEGRPERQEASVLYEYGIKISNFAPRELIYDNIVKGQIEEQQKIAMQVQTARAHALEAEQRRITAEADGKAAVMKAQYEKEQEKIQAVVDAQKELEVAKLQTQAAEQTKRKEILLGEGESQRKRLVMSADGALEKKLETYEKVNEMYAKAISEYHGSWVPSVVMGGQNSGTVGHPGGAATDLVQLLLAKTARELALDMKVSGSAKTVSAD